MTITREEYVKNRYCVGCGRKLIKVRTGSFYNAETGEQGQSEYVCPQSDTVLGFWRAWSKSIVHPFRYHVGDYGGYEL